MNEFEILSYFICFFNMATRQPPYLLLNSFNLCVCVSTFAMVIYCIITLVCESHRRQSWGLGSRDPQILRWGVAGGRGGVVKYYYILSCTGSMFESGDFLREIG